MEPRLGDQASTLLAARLKSVANGVRDPQRSTILSTLPHTLFISHTSRDDAYITGTKDGTSLAQPGSILSTCWEYFYDPFYHSTKTGGAEAYERIIGLALLAADRVLIIWSKNVLRSIYVRAEILIATEGTKRVAALLAPDAPPFPLAQVPSIHGLEELRRVLQSWK